MQLIFSQDKPTDIAAEFDALVASYWAAENPGHVPHNLDWFIYATLSDAGICRAFSVRNGRDRLVGCVFYNVVNHPHHKGYKVAEGDMICVHPQYRGLGIGSRLMEFAEPYLVADGVQEITHRHKAQYATVPLYVSHGYAINETVYRKKVG